jgi:hypothetical protein
MGQVYQCWWRICREINAFFFRFEYHMFYILYPSVTYLLTLPRTLIMLSNGTQILLKHDAPVGNQPTRLSAAQYTEGPITARMISRRRFGDVTDYHTEYV